MRGGSYPSHSSSMVVVQQMSHGIFRGKKSFLKSFYVRSHHLFSHWVSCVSPFQGKEGWRGGGSKGERAGSQRQLAVAQFFIHLPP